VDGGGDDRFFTFQSSGGTGVPTGSRVRAQHINERLIVLQNMGFAECEGPNIWRVRRDFETVLQAMQRIGDRQKTLAAHGVPISDERLTVATLDFRDLTTVEGRVLVHGEEEQGRDAGRRYLLLEGTDARVHHIYYTPEMEDERNRGGLRTNSFVRLRKLFSNGQPRLEIGDFGNAEEVLGSKTHLKRAARNLIGRGIIPGEDGWRGWLGRYQTALKQAAMEEASRGRSRVLDRKRDLGRR
jgi:hypothetical protein